MSLLDMVMTVVALSGYYEVDPVYAINIVTLESSWDPNAIGDGGKAVGLWQWHLKSWEYVREKMKLPLDDLRTDPYEATRTALYAIGVLDLERWWSTAEKAIKMKVNLQDEISVKERPHTRPY